MEIQTMKINIKPLGDSALIVQLGDSISASIQTAVGHLATLLTQHPFVGFIEAAPAYNSLTVYYNPLAIYSTFTGSESQTMTAFEKVSIYIEALLKEAPRQQTKQGKTVEIPVIYGGDFGPDLEYVAHFHGLTSEEVIRIHSEKSYLVYMIGFAPGFPFLGGLDERIATPRKASPRLSVPVGSVGIAGEQTGVYPLETPGGWQIIGQSPLNLFLPEATPPTLLEAGDIIRFIPITQGDVTSEKGWRK